MFSITYIKLFRQWLWLQAVITVGRLRFGRICFCGREAADWQLAKRYGPLCSFHHTGVIQAAREMNSLGTI
jgi:hypothetical protein